MHARAVFGVGKVSCLERYPQFRSILIEGLYVPPDTGASINSADFLLVSSATARASSGAIVLESIRREPGCTELQRQ